MFDRTTYFGTGFIFFGVIVGPPFFWYTTTDTALLLWSRATFGFDAVSATVFVSAMLWFFLCPFVTRDSRF